MRRVERAAQTRGRILTAARARFLAVGYQATTIRDVAQGAGVSLGLVHAHFRDKRALLLACFADELALVIDQALAELDPRRSLIDRLCAIAQALYLSYARRGELSRDMVREALFQRADDPPDHNFPRFVAAVATLLAAPSARRSTRTKARATDPGLGAHGFFALYLAVLIGGLRGPLDGDPGALAAGWTTQLRAGLIPWLEGLGLDPAAPASARGARSDRAPTRRGAPARPVESPGPLPARRAAKLRGQRGER